MIYTEQVKNAMNLAFCAHKMQYDKGEYPYISHPLFVANGMDTETEICVALLHDVLEDSKITEKFMARNGISKEVIEIVKILTKPKETEYFEYIKGIKKNKIATKVKLKDLEHNMMLSRLKTITQKDLERIAKYEQAYQMLKGE